MEGSTMKTRLPIVLSSVLLAAAIAVVLAVSSGEGTPTPTTAGPAPAAAVQISSSSELIGGPLARGAIGDYLLSNGEIRVVIQRPLRNLLSVGQFGGQIIDADLVRTFPDPDRDSFEEFGFGVNIENTCHYTSVSVIDAGGGANPAVIRATGVDDLLDFINPSSQVAGFGFPFPSTYDDADLPVTCSTDYTLAPNSDYVEIETTITNNGGTTIDTFFTEFMNGSGQVKLFEPGYGFGQPLVTTPCPQCNFVAWEGIGDAEGVAYGHIFPIAGSTVFNTGGVSIPVFGANAALTLIGGASPNYSIPASGGTASVTRYFTVGEDVGDIVDTRNVVAGYTTGTLSGTVTEDPGGAPIEGAEVVVIGDVADGPGGDTGDPADDVDYNIVAHYTTDASGDYAGTLTPGDYAVIVHREGHMPGTPDPASVTITASSTTDQDFTVPVSGRIQVTIDDENSAPLSGKVSIVGFDPNPDPYNTQTYLGLINNRTGVFTDPASDSLPFGVARIINVGENGDSGEVFIEPGDYHVVVSHGTEYSVYEEDVTITAGNLTSVSAQIAPVIDTTGFISADFHVHQVHSPDSEVSLPDRVVSALAEGLEFLPPSDHEHRTDLSGLVASMGADDKLSVAGNNENTTPDYGHFNAWPVEFDTAAPNGGALDWASAGGSPPAAGTDFPSFGSYNMPPSEIFASLLADPGVDSVQINHHDTFFGPGGLSIDTAYIPPRDFATNSLKRLDPSITNLWDDGFTALETWQGTGRGDIFNRFYAHNLGDWFNLINQGIVRGAVGDSDTHKLLADAISYPRTYVASPTDDASALDDSSATLEGLATNVNEGRVVATNGPFIRVTSSAASTGQSGGHALGDPTLIATTNGAATIDVHIESPLWAQFDRIEYYVNTVPTPDYFDNLASTPPYWNVAPTTVQTAGTDFTINTIDDFPSIPGAEHLEADAQLNLSGMTDDTWVVVIVRGSDNVSEPTFPVIPNDLNSGAISGYADLIDSNLGEGGVPALAFSNPLFISVGGTAGYDTHPVDNDRDGCTNDQELGPTAILGGTRSPSIFWDFFDTPNPSGVRDGAINVSDISRVVARFGSSAAAPSKANAYTQALAVPPAAPAYSPAFDRTAAGSLSGPPDGSVAISDISRIVAQFGHNC
jgi:hypothetical protein